MEEKGNKIKEGAADIYPGAKVRDFKGHRGIQDDQEGLAKHQLADLGVLQMETKLEVGVRASLRNSRPLKSADLKTMGKPRTASSKKRY